MTGWSCGRSAAGTFFFQNHAQDRWLTGSTDTESNGPGVYRRAAGDSGLYSTLGLTHSLSTRRTIPGRAGVKWFDLNRSVATELATMSGSMSTPVGAVEVGYREVIRENLWLDAWLTGDAGEQFVSGGGRLGVTIGF